MSKLAVDSEVLIFGDLAVDIKAALPADSKFRPLDQARDVSLFVEYEIGPAGTSLLFASAVAEFAAGVPDVIACIGDDQFGRYVANELKTRKFTADGIQVTQRARTAVIFLAYRNDNTRLMVQSKSTANRWLSEEQINLYLDDGSHANVAMMWVSGYCLADSDAPRLQAIRAAANWARQRHIPVVVDLVPHEFRRYVGDHHSVDALIGRVTGLVGELRTVREFYEPTSESIDSWDSLEKYAELLCRDREFSIVQHRISVHTYAQIAIDGSGQAFRSEMDLRTTPIHGLGDRMAVLGMKQLRILP